MMRRDMSPGRRGRGKTLTFEYVRADKGYVSSARSTFFGALRRRLRGERGQAMVEFALIAPLFLAIVVGIIQFGLLLNFWLDEQRIANQGARWAVVNNWPECDRFTTNAIPCKTGAGTLQTYLANQRNAEGEGINVFICFPNTTSNVGDPVKVIVSQKFRFMQIVPVMPAIDIGASATMRLEQKPGRYAASGACP